MLADLVREAESRFIESSIPVTRVLGFKILRQLRPTPQAGSFRPHRRLRRQAPRSGKLQAFPELDRAA
jgi:hypothetical protein